MKTDAQNLEQFLLDKGWVKKQTPVRLLLHVASEMSRLADEEPLDRDCLIRIRSLGEVLVGIAERGLR